MQLDRPSFLALAACWRGGARAPDLALRRGRGVRRGDAGAATVRAGEAEDVIDAVRLAPVHDLRPTIVSVAADGDAGRQPMAADRPDETADMATDLDARGRLAGPQDHGHRTTGGGVVDVDRQKAALVEVGVEER